MHQVRKVALMGLLAAMAAIGPVKAMAEEEASGVSASLDVPVLSAYVWRGQVLNEDEVLQPTLTVEKGGFAINWWGNMNLTDDQTGDDFEFTEHDIGVSYSMTCPLTGGALSLGIVNYDFPNQETADALGNPSLVKDTREAYASLGMESWLLAPSLSVNYDFKEADGFYVNLGVGHSIALSEKVSADLAASVGYADSDYNTYYFGVDDSALNDANVSLSVPFAVTPNLTITPAVKYTWLLDSDIEDAAEALYADKDQTVGSVTASYTF